MFVEVEKEFAAKGVVFVAVSLDDAKTRKNIPEFVRKYGVDFPVWEGGTPDDLDRLKLGNAVPDTAFLGEDGAVLFRVKGEIRRAELVERLTWLTGDRKGPAPLALLRNL